MKGIGANECVVGLAIPFVGRIENAHGGTANVRGGNEKLGGLL